MAGPTKDEKQTALDILKDVQDKAREFREGVYLYEVNGHLTSWQIELLERFIKKMDV